MSLILKSAIVFVDNIAKSSCVYFGYHTEVYFTGIQGALVGSVCGMLLVMWINVGRLVLNVTYPSLPSTSVDRCSTAVANDTALLWQQYDVTTSSSSVTHSYYSAQVRSVLAVVLLSCFISRFIPSFVLTFYLIN